MKKNKRKEINFKKIITEHVKLNVKIYMCVFIILVIGIIIGMYFVGNLSDIQKQELSVYVVDTITQLQEDTEIDKLLLFKNSAIENIILTIIMWFVGSTVVGLPIVYGIVAFRGFCLGYTISAIIAILGTSKGMLFVFTALFFQNIIFIPAILALAVSGTKLYKSIMKDKRRENIKLEIIRHTIFSGIVGIMLLISSLVEVYISTNVFYICLKIIT